MEARTHRRRAIRLGVIGLGAIVLIAASACQPQDGRPGLWLRGERVSGPVPDWGFTDAFTEIFVETRTWYGVPHSVTTVCAAADGQLYVPSLYYGGEEFPDARYWNRNVVRDPRVRLKIGRQLYARRAELVSSEPERRVVYSAFVAKYAFWREMLAKPEAEWPKIILFRMAPRETSDER